ncbi:MAG: hypothetical protein ACRDK9_10350 [Solirubrobacterales bacterium]
MPTTIRFSGPGAEGGPLSTYVSESPSELLDKWIAAAGNPIALTHDESGREMYVNPQVIACWFERPEE